MAALTTAEAVCNLALGLVGQRQFIDRLDEPSTEAQVATVYYEQTRNKVLAAFRWRFATQRAVLALTAETRSGWTFAYAAPAKMLVAQRIFDGNRNPGEGEEIPFAKELNDAGDGYLILTDQPDAELIFTRELTTVALFPPHFVDALAAHLAVCFAGALPVKPQLMPGFQMAAERSLLTAAAIDANEAVADPAPESKTIRIRRR
ncbi:MAG: hypothetical protein DI536_04235 [Archangium gephyra]|uniref:Uncharacterized protein n=1 Tax=Archangium gephyra TaxID=48 RepID=A0A2W5V7V7_9BACT|nr:MAG: hypothetical protein DI536_04235 [Archangium gephyra]